eukprot:scaffold5362_cov67-Phaeocystis_antarctica.AAC.6
MKKARTHISKHLISSYSDAGPQCALVGWQHRGTALACARRSFLLTWRSLTYLPSSARVKVVRASRLSDMKCTALSPSDTACARARAACLITSSSVCNVECLSPWRTCGWQHRVDARHQRAAGRVRQGKTSQGRFLPHPLAHMHRRRLVEWRLSRATAQPHVGGEIVNHPADGVLWAHHERCDIAKAREVAREPPAPVDVIAEPVHKGAMLRDFDLPDALRVGQSARAQLLKVAIPELGTIAFYIGKKLILRDGFAVALCEGA